MQIVIDIDEKTYKAIEFFAIRHLGEDEVADKLLYAIKTGIVLLPKDHGRLIDVDKINVSEFFNNNYIHESQKPKECIWCAYLDKPSDEPPCKDCDGTCNYVSWRGCG